MTQKKPIAVDFSQEVATLQVLSRPELLSSRQAGWNGMYFEYYHQPPHETPEHYPSQHVVAIQTEGQVQAERRLDGRLQQEQIVTGDVCVVPAHTHHWIHSTGDQGLILLSFDPTFLARVAYESSAPDRVELVPLEKLHESCSSIARDLRGTNMTTARQIEQPMQTAKLLQNRVALVTGASRGIGAAIAKLFAQHGAAVGINDSQQ